MLGEAVLQRAYVTALIGLVRSRLLCEDIRDGIGRSCWIGNGPLWRLMDGTGRPGLVDEAPLQMANATAMGNFAW